MPRSAKRVFKGEIFDVYHWQQKMFDGTYGRWERLKRSDSANVVAVTSDKKIIINDEQQPGKDKFISLPGGRVDKNESPLQAAKRELLEESGYVSDRWELWFKFQASSKIEWIAYIFVARDCRKISDPTPDSGEVIKTKLVSFERFIDLIVSDEYRDIELKLELLKTKFDKKKIAQLRRYLIGG